MCSIDTLSPLYLIQIIEYIGCLYNIYKQCTTGSCSFYIQFSRCYRLSLHYNFQTQSKKFLNLNLDILPYISKMNYIEISCCGESEANGIYRYQQSTTHIHEYHNTNHRYKLELWCFEEMNLICLSEMGNPYQLYDTFIQKGLKLGDEININQNQWRQVAGKKPSPLLTTITTQKKRKLFEKDGDDHDPYFCCNPKKKQKIGPNSSRATNFDGLIGHFKKLDLSLMTSNRYNDDVKYDNNKRTQSSNIAKKRGTKRAHNCLSDNKSITQTPAQKRRKFKY